MYPKKTNISMEMDRGFEDASVKMNRCTQQYVLCRCAERCRGGKAGTRAQGGSDSKQASDAEPEGGHRGTGTLIGCMRNESRTVPPEAAEPQALENTTP